MITKGKIGDELRDLWQVRALAHADGKLQRVLLIALYKEYPADILILLRVAFGQIEIPNVMYTDYAAILPNGHVACEQKVRENGLVWKGFVKVYDSENRFLYDARRLADKLKLNDADRTDMFRVLKKWIAKDMRVDPNGEKRLAS